MQSKPRNKAPSQPKPRNKAPEQSNDPRNKLQPVVYNPPETSSKIYYPPELGEILRSHIDGILKPLRKEIREIERAGEINKGKQVPEKSIDTAGKKISFEFVGDQEWLQQFPGSDILLSKLAGWEIKGEKRKSANTWDM
ncbi:hypothetical protein A2U01_0013066, partial [Trifolium medium]|nr:hypothetical protein [Trifolium medium]